MLDFETLLLAMKSRLNTDSATQVAISIGVDRTSISNIVNKRRSVGPDIARKISSFLNVPLPVIYSAIMYSDAPTREEMAGWLAAYTACKGFDYEKEIREEIAKKPLLAA
ncbi:helix-turn-helix transcriptional regulator [Chitinibacter bivalviorum]|uniref:Helix-turn-helix transcriptional regulator n=1 Tax=Chitinibacter bivalviorum TaxID=2739434 RepID=A0A7H9BJ50_9NEIS|nr:helix-turn-helix transcriptional regulator [Chitinibacter bivalviorum]QLG87584.1 helix-turn-helix transcriptional regulator [Chitinibacter bivalviorum]